MNDLINLGKKYDIDIEIFKEKNKTTEISTLNDELKLFQVTDVVNYIIKAIKNNRCIKIVTEDITDSQKIVNTLDEIFCVSDNKNINKLCKGNIKNIEKNTKEIDYSLVKSDLLSLNNLKKEYPCIKNIESEYIYFECNKEITNKVNDCDMEDESYVNLYTSSITVEKNGINRILYLAYYTKDYNFQEFNKYLLKKLKYLIIKLDSTSVKTNKYKVLLTNNVVDNILSTFINSFQSKAIYLNESILTDKLNKKIFDDKITIIEDSPNGIYKSNFDSEGTIKKKQTLVENGIFKKEINNIEYALKLNNLPTGNANGVNNLYIKKGNKSFDELIKILDTGIIIDEAFGFHSGVDTKTGNISVQAEGFLVKNGKITKGLNMILLSTNFFEVFTNVLELGNDLSNFNLNVSTPSLLLDNITITGGVKYE